MLTLYNKKEPYNHIKLQRVTDLGLKDDEPNATYKYTGEVDNDEIFVYGDFDDLVDEMDISDDRIVELLQGSGNDTLSYGLVMNLHFDGKDKPIESLHNYFCQLSVEIRPDRVY